MRCASWSGLAESAPPLGASVNVLYEDLSSGVLPCRLLELLTGRKIRHRATPKNRYELLENASSFLQADSIPTTSQEVSAKFGIRVVVYEF